MSRASRRATDWGRLGALPRHRTLAAWRRSLQADTLLGARFACWEEAHLAWAEAILPDANTKTRYPHAVVLAEMPVWVYGGDLRETWGDGIWTDGLHLWVSEGALADARRRGFGHYPLLHLPQGVSSAKANDNLPLAVLPRLLLRVAGNLPNALASDAEPLALPRPWPQVRDTLVQAGHGAFVEALPERDWDLAQIRAFWTAGPSRLPPDEHAAWDAWCQTPNAEEGRLPAGWSDLCPHSAPDLRRLQSVWDLAAHAWHQTAPDADARWLRFVAVWIHTAQRHPRAPWLGAIGRVAAGRMLDINTDHVAQGAWLQARAWLPALVRDWATWMPDEPWLSFRHWNTVWAEVRDGAEPWTVDVGNGCDALTTAMSTWGDSPASIRAWLRLWSPPEGPAWWRDPTVWTHASSRASVTWLLDQGADPNARFSQPYEAYTDRLAADDRTPLHLVRGWSWTPTLVRRFVDAGADPNARDSHGYTPLFFADSDILIQALLDAGADVTARSFPTDDARPETSRSALSYQLRHGLRMGPTAVSLQRLLEHGADPNERPDHGMPLTFLVLRDHDLDSFVRIQALLEALKTLQAHGARLGNTDPDGHTLLHELARQGGVMPSHAKGLRALLQWLYDQGLRGETPDTAGETPLEVAATSGTEPFGRIVVEFFLRQWPLEQAAVIDRALVRARGKGVMEALMGWKTGVQAQALGAAMPGVAPGPVTRRRF